MNKLIMYFSKRRERIAAIRFAVVCERTPKVVFWDTDFQIF
jgi:hypothetical protein